MSEAGLFYALGSAVILAGLWGIVFPEKMWGARATGRHRLLYRLAGLVAIAGGIILISKSYD